ncbi:MAG: DUF6273 domain-containing protein [Oscillospiraceae bacterium]|jgi:hypothetical protein|nr:DUF6273 domain-containing protein [Oscillospiraceae bacterium]
MGEKRYQVFISSTYEDLKEERLQVINALLEAGKFFPVSMEAFVADGDEQFECIKKYIDVSDYYIVIIAGRYGSPAPDGKSYTEKEYDYACEKLGKKRVLVFPSKNDTYYNDPENAEKLRAFRKRATNNCVAAFWPDVGKLVLKIINALNKAVENEQRPDASWVRASELPTDSAIAQELAKANDSLRKLEQQRTELLHERDGLNVSLTKAKQTLGDRDKTCAQLLAEKQALEGEITALREQIAAMERHVAAPIVAPKPKLTLTKGQDFRFGDYDWSVLAVEEGKALLLAKNVIEQRAYNNSLTATTWEECTLRKYLNGAFYNGFSGEDQKRILVAHNKNFNNTYGVNEKTPFNTKGGEPTDDKVFLLSLSAVRKYFGEGKPSKWDEKPLNSNGDFLWIDDDYNKARVCSDLKGEQSWWWLRSPGDTPDGAAGVSYGGNVRLNGDDVNDSSGGVRPALWLNLEV